MTDTSTPTTSAGDEILLNATTSVDGETSLKAALIIQYISLGLVVVLSVVFIVLAVLAVRLSRDVRGLPLLGALSSTRLVLCSLACVFSVAHILRVPLSTFAYGFGDLENVVNGILVSFGNLKIPPTTETLLCRVYLTATSATLFPLFLFIVLNVLRIPELRVIPKHPNTYVFVRSIMWCFPFTVLYLLAIWMEPLLNTFVMREYLAVRAPWMPEWVYKVTGSDLKCPSDTWGVHQVSLAEGAAGAYGTGGGAPEREVVNGNGTATEVLVLTNHICEYCVYPITVTCVSFAFAAIYLLMFVVRYASLSMSIVSHTLHFRLRILLVIFTALIPLSVCVQAILVIPMLDMIAVQILWICAYAASALVLAGGVVVMAVWQMFDASRAGKVKAGRVGAFGGAQETEIEFQSVEMATLQEGADQRSALVGETLQGMESSTTTPFVTARGSAF